jgi:hypothetical protein
LNEERLKAKQKPVPAAEVSFWYLVNHLGGRFRGKAAQKLGVLEPSGEGVWHARLLDRHLFLVSTVDVPVEPDAVPLHLLGQEPAEKELALVRLVVQQPSLRELYGEILGTLHPQTLKELGTMARTAKGPKFHLKPLVELMGYKEPIEQLDSDRVIDQLVMDEKKKKKILARLRKHLSPAERAEWKCWLESEKT